MLITPLPNLGPHYVKCPVDTAAAKGVRGKALILPDKATIFEEAGVCLSAAVCDMWQQPLPRMIGQQPRGSAGNRGVFREKT